MNTRIIYGIVDSDYITDAIAKIRFEISDYAYNAERKTSLIRWRSFIETDANSYTTSNKLQKWTMIASEKQYPGIAPISDADIVQTGYADINTDINDLKEIASGSFETQSTGRLYFSFKIDPENIILIDMNNETGVEVSTIAIVGDNYYEEAFNIIIPSYNYYSVGIVGANNFNDEENPVLNLSTVSTYQGRYEYDISSFISLNGYNDVIFGHSSLNINNNMGEISNLTFTYNFTEEERGILRADLPNQPSKEIFIFLENRRTENATNVEIIRYYVKRTLSIVNANPVFNPVVNDTNATTLALTGDKNVIVRYGSNAYVESNVELQKHAGSIVNHSISVGGKTTTAQTHTFNAVEGDTFTFTATDSRGFNTTIDVKPPFVDYVKLTCNLEAQVVDANTGVLSFEISGNYFNDSFGAANNNLGVSYRVREKDAAWGNWVNLSGATFKDNSYTVEGSVSGLNYQKTYEIQAMAIDRLNTITTPIITLTTIPIFDWGKNDFNFNVPVNFSGSANFDKATTFNSTIAVEDAATFNGDIVFNGNVDFGGNIITADNVNTATTTFDTDNLLADYIIETGEEAMGSNGVWKWQKWKSGKAEAWGKRNYGNMSFSTTYYGSLYQSSNFTQDLPSIFSEEPDTIEINIIKSNAGVGAGAFVLRGIDIDASTSSTGSFAICKRNNGTLSQVYLGFHVIGTWKE